MKKIFAAAAAIACTPFFAMAYTHANYAGYSSGYNYPPSYVPGQMPGVYGQNYGTQQYGYPQYAQGYGNQQYGYGASGYQQNGGVIPGTYSYAAAPVAGNYLDTYHPEAFGYTTDYNSIYPPYYYGNIYPAYHDHYGSQTPYAPNQYSFRDYPPPQTYQSPTGMYDVLGTPLCNWSDYPTSAPCGSDPQQWVQDIYTGQWY